MEDEAIGQVAREPAAFLQAFAPRFPTCRFRVQGWRMCVQFTQDPRRARGSTSFSGLIQLPAWSLSIRCINQTCWNDHMVF